MIRRTLCVLKRVMMWHEINCDRIQWELIDNNWLLSPLLEIVTYHILSISSRDFLCSAFHIRSCPPVLMYALCLLKIACHASLQAALNIFHYYLFGTIHLLVEKAGQFEAAWRQVRGSLFYLPQSWHNSFPWHPLHALWRGSAQPPACCDGHDAPFTLQDVIASKKGGLVAIFNHNEIRDELVTWLKRLSHPLKYATKPWSNLMASRRVRRILQPKTAAVGRRKQK